MHFYSKLGRNICVKKILTSLRYSSTGLFGVRKLLNPSDFSKLANESIRKCNAVRERLSSLIEVNSSTLLLLDSISNEICSVIDVAELARNVHSDEAYRIEAEKSFSIMSSFICELNKDKTLYNTLMKIYDNKVLWSELNDEQRLLAIDLKREFEADGIHLQEIQKQRLTALQERVSNLETGFMQTAASQDNELYPIGPFGDSQDHARIKSWLQRVIPQSTISDIPPGHVLCSSNKRIANSLLPSLDNASIRQQIWLGAAAQPEANMAILGGMLRTRQELAASLGYPSWAHKTLSNSVVGGPENVWKFLQETADATKVQAEKELVILLDLKKRLGQESSPLSPWDVSYLSEMHRSLSSRSSNITAGRNGHVHAQTEISNYLTIDACMAALTDLSLELFGLRLVAQELGADEGWGTQQGGMKLLVQDSNHEPVGVVYLDLFPRLIKLQGAAHFTIKCGCSHLDAHESEPPSSGIFPANNPQRQQKYQLPIVALVFNFSAGNDHSVPKLSLHDLTTLFHEWGHALHSLLSRTTYQHLSGTRGSLDFVEIPSHLLEHFARCPALLQRWGRHYKTGQPPSLSLATEALTQRALFGAFEAQSQLLYSFADQFVFGSQIGDISALSDVGAFHAASSGIAQVQREFTVLPVASSIKPGSNQYTHQPYMYMLSHSHFVTYGGSYYSYLFSKMYAAQLWQLHFANDPLSRQGGKFLHEDILQYGAARDTKLLLAGAVGGALNPSFYTKDLQGL